MAASRRAATPPLSVPLEAVGITAASPEVGTGHVLGVSAKGEAGEIKAAPNSYSLEAEAGHYKADGGDTFYPATVSVQPYETMTMKQLVRKALIEHFPEGASTGQLLNFFHDAWGRKIERANLSPQLSRLKQDNVIAQRGHSWVYRNSALLDSKESSKEDGAT